MFVNPLNVCFGINPLIQRIGEVEKGGPLAGSPPPDMASAPLRLIQEIVALYETSYNAISQYS